MSIKPDWWIRERALEGMIEPFVDRLERQGVISYGLSSFGYDLRAAPEWRIFVNAFNTVVDPKDFDTRSLVESTEDVCIIPPNSFVLTRSVEYLRIPDDVMVVALGKSSYARCFRGDTRVALVDGSAPTLEDMADRARDGELFFGYSIGAEGRLIVSQLSAPRLIGRDNLIEIELDSGARVHATEDHAFMLRDGSWLPAGELASGTALMPLYRQNREGWSMAYQPRTGRYTSLAGLMHDRQKRLVPGRIIHRSRGTRVLEEPRRDADPPGRYLNHRVAAIRRLRGEEDVYCLTVPEAGNFALEAGIFVSNCGIVANVTPLEPGWEGHVTLELSNTTPLPAKVYANEGVVQLLFFQGERPEVTYRDRKGKYQGQTGVTLPKL